MRSFHTNCKTLYMKMIAKECCFECGVAKSHSYFGLAVIQLFVNIINIISLNTCWYKVKICKRNGFSRALVPKQHAVRQQASNNRIKFLSHTIPWKLKAAQINAVNKYHGSVADRDKPRPQTRHRAASPSARNSPSEGRAC